MIRTTEARQARHQRQRLRRPPRYVQRYEAVKHAIATEAGEDAWIELAVRFHDGDLADTRYPMWAREMAWFLLIGDHLVGVSEKKATVAAHYAGVTIETDTLRGWWISGQWQHG